MALIKLNRINKGGEILIETAHIVFIEIESRVTTVHLDGGSLFSVEESLSAIAEKAAQTEIDRIKIAIQESGVGQKPITGL
jgi:hypothetical protein